jgi:hypothetical protein
MHFTPCPDLTFRLMRIGCTLHDAERFAALLTTGLVVVATIMGCTIRPPDEEEEEDRQVCVYPRTNSRDTGIVAGGTVGLGIVMDSQLEHLLHF